MRVGLVREALEGLQAGTSSHEFQPRSLALPLPPQLWITEKVTSMLAFTTNAGN